MHFPLYCGVAGVFLSVSFALVQMDSYRLQRQLCLLPFPAPTVQRLRFLLLRANREKSPVEFCAPPSVVDVPFPHFCITRETFSGLLTFSAHLQGKSGTFACKRVASPILEAAGAFTRQTPSYSQSLSLNS